VEEVAAHRPAGRQEKGRRTAGDRYWALVTLDDLRIAGPRGSNREEQGLGEPWIRRSGWWRPALEAMVAEGGASEMVMERNAEEIGRTRAR
jgi:hypothetical protein